MLIRTVWYYRHIRKRPTKSVNSVYLVGVLVEKKNYKQTNNEEKTYEIAKYDEIVGKGGKIWVTTF